MVNNLNDRINCETGELNPPIGMAEAGHGEEAATGGAAFTREFGRGFKAGRESAHKIERAEPSRGAPDAAHKISQVTVVGLPQPKSWADYRRGALANYGGGHHNDGQLEAFRHGMETVFNLIEAEFPSAEQCKSLHVVLLEALRHTLCEHLKVHEDLDFNVCSDCGFRWNHRKSLQRALRDEAEAAIQQAERT